MMESLKSLLEKLENQGKLKKQKAGIDYLNDLLHAADRNFRAAAANVDDFEETAFKAAYDGMLQISKVVLLLNGYKTDDGEQHKTTFEVAGAILGSEFGELINKINVYRKKRNMCVYEAGLVTRKEAENILKTSGEYWRKVKEYLRENAEQLKLF